MASQTLGVVVPVYGGEAYLDSLTAEVERARRALSDDKAPVQLTSLTFVLDGPRDKSADVAQALAEQYPWVSVLTLSKNYGQHPATAAGILHTATDWVATLDEDLQHSPADLGSMIKLAVRDSADVVYGRSKRVHGGWRDWSSRSAKASFVRMTGIKAARYFSSFRVVRGSIARAAASVVGHETYLDVAISWFTDRAVPYQTTLVDSRKDSGYRFRSLVGHYRRLVISSDARALRLSSFLGTVGVTVALAAMLWLLAGTIFDFRVAERGWLSIVTSVVFFGGILTLMNGLLSEYVLNIAQRIQGRPTFATVDRSRDNELLAWANADRGESDPPHQS